MAEFALAQIGQWLVSNSDFSGRVSGFQIDSRAVRPGDLFFALKGEKVDGHQFLLQAKEKGAVAAVIAKGYEGERHGLPCLEVDTVLPALQRLAQRVHSQRKCRVIGVTGSVGKTTTKEFLATLLEKKFKVAKTPGNANSQVSLPLNILNSPGDEEVFVMEMGMSEPKELERLVAIAPPEIALITKIALAHAAFFPGGLESIAAAKAEILSHPHTRLGILNSQVACFSAPCRIGSCLKKTYALEGEDAQADVVLCKEGDLFYVRDPSGESPRFSLPFSAFHLCEDFLGAAVVAREMGLEWEEILPQAKELKSYKNRFEQIERRGVVILNDSYNANPTSMRAALLNLPIPKTGGKTIAVLGEMTPLGRFSEEGHLEVGRVALGVVDQLLCLGKECLPMVELFKKEGRPVEWCESLEAIKKRLEALAHPGDVVLIKGSNSNQLWKVLEES